jgi:hypothetical protein
MNGTPLMQGAQRFRVLDSAKLTIKPITQKTSSKIKRRLLNQTANPSTKSATAP